MGRLFVWLVKWNHKIPFHFGFGEYKNPNMTTFQSRFEEDLRNMKGIGPTKLTYSHFPSTNAQA
jgi:hypothetical protein